MRRAERQGLHSHRVIPSAAENEQYARSLRLLDELPDLTPDARKIRERNLQLALHQISPDDVLVPAQGPAETVKPKGRFPRRDTIFPKPH